MKVKVKVEEEKEPELPQVTKKKLEANLKKFYIYRIFQSLMFFLPFYILFLQENGLSITQIFILESIYLIITVIMSIPGGLFADNFGRKKAIFISAVLMFVACLTYGLSTTFLQFLIAEIVFGLAFALYSGVDAAFIYDTLVDLDRRDDYRRVYGNIGFISLCMFGVAALIGGYMASESLRLTYLFALVPFFVAIFIPLTFTEPMIHQSEKKHIAQLKDSFFFSIKHRRVRNLLLYFAVLVGIVHMSFFYTQLYLKAIGIPLFMFGYVYIAGFVLEGLGAKFADIIEGILGEKKTLVTMVSVAFLSMFFMGVVGTWLGFIFPVVLFIIWGFAEPVISSYINEHVSSFRRATIMSIKNMTKGLITGLAVPLFGYLIDIFSLQTAILLSAAILFVQFLILLYMLYVTKSFEVSS